MVVAAGNDGPNNRGFSPPASADGAIVVGAVDDRGTVDREDDEVADFSSRGPRASDGDDDPYDELKPDVVAPGVDITSLANSFSTLPAAGYVTASGTSFSAPIVAGVVALMLEANPSLTPRQVREILHITAEARGEPYDPSLPFPHSKWNPAYGYGIVNAYEAVRMALALKGAALPAPHLLDVPSPDEDGNFTLSWTAVPGAESYVLVESPEPAFTRCTCHYYLNGTSFNVMGRPPGTYYFRVVARGMGTFSNMSNTVSVTVSGGSGPPPLPAPEFLEDELVVREGNYTVEWSGVEGTTSYLLQEATSPDFSDARDLYNGEETSFTVRGRGVGDYYYRVKALGEGRESPWSSTLRVHVQGGNGSSPGAGNETGQPTGGGGAAPPEEGGGEQRLVAVALAVIAPVALVLILVRLRRRGHSPGLS